MNNRLKRQERESVRSRYATSELLYKVMSGPARELECEMKQFRFSVEELYAYVLSVLDNIKERPADAMDGVVRNLWNTVYCDLRDMDVSDSPDEEIRLATTEVVCVVVILLSMCEGILYNNLSYELLGQLNQYHSEAYIDIQNRFMPSVWRLGEEMVRARIMEYMDSDDEWISDDIEEMIQKLPSPQPQAESAVSKSTKGEPTMTNRQLIILFAHMLNITLSSEQTNINAFANLLSAINGHSANSIRTNIRSGIDYESATVHNDIDYLVSLVEPVSPKLSRLLKNNKKEK